MQKTIKYWGYDKVQTYSGKKYSYTKPILSLESFCGDDLKTWTIGKLKIFINRFCICLKFFICHMQSVKQCRSDDCIALEESDIFDYAVHSVYRLKKGRAVRFLMDHMQSSRQTETKKGQITLSLGLRQAMSRVYRQRRGQAGSAKSVYLPAGRQGGVVKGGGGGEGQEEAEPEQEHS